MSRETDAEMRGAPRSREPLGRFGRVLLLSSVLIIWPLFSGCSSVAPYQQRLVSKPNMSFTGAGAFVYQSKMLAQTEPGSMFSGGARAVGCAACGQ